MPGVADHIAAECARRGLSDEAAGYAFAAAVHLDHVFGNIACSKDRLCIHHSSAPGSTWAWQVGPDGSRRALNGPEARR